MRGLALLCALLVHCRLPAAVDSVWLTWQRDPCTTMTVQWLSDAGEMASEILFARVGAAHSYKVAGTHTPLPGTDDTTLVHSVELFGLAPDTRYVFQINADEKQRYFHTMPTKLSRPIRFVAGGDVYHETIEIVEHMHQQAAAASPDFALVGGDIAYSVTSKTDTQAAEKIGRWKEFFRVWSERMITPDGNLIPILPIVGNHDVLGGYRQPESRAACFYALFPLPGEKGYQVLDFGDYLTLLLLDSGHTHEIAGKQTHWLEKTLAKHAHVLHKVALYHVGAWPSVREENSRSGGGRIRKNWVPVFEKYHLSVAFENHDHAYKRTHLIRNDSVTEGGVLYLGDGAWGTTPRKPHDASERWYLAKTASRQHVIIAELTPYTRSYRATDARGRVFDFFIQYIPFSAGPEPSESKRASTLAIDPSLFLPLLAR